MLQTAASTPDHLSLLRATGILEQLRQGLCVFDGTRKLLLFNHRYADVYGITPDQLTVGMSLDEVVDLRSAAGTGPEMPRGEYLARRAAVADQGAGETVVKLSDGRLIEIYHKSMPDGGWVSTHDDITERLAAEDALRQKTALLDATLDTMDQGLLMTDAQGSIAVANRRVSELLGADPAFLATKPHFTEFRRVQAEAGEYATGGATFQNWVSGNSLQAPSPVYERVRPNGTALEVRSVDLASGGALRTYTDITGRKAAERVLREQTARLNATLENMDQGLLMVDATGIVRVCNERAIQLLDLPRELMRSQPTFTAVLENQFARNEFSMSDEAFRSWVAAGGLDREAQTYERKRPNGTVLEVRTIPLPDGSAVRTYSDITERKQAETALSESRDRLALALESGSDGLWDWNVETGDIWLSERWWKMLGYAPGEIEPHIDEWFRLVHPDDEERARVLLKDHCAGRTALYECEYRLRTRAGDWNWVLARGKVVSRGAAGRPHRIVGTHIDIGARKLAENRIAHMARHDGLTELPNRALFRERLDGLIADVRVNGGHSAVLCLDLDRFKAVNDTLGHFAGDILLREVADRVRGQLMPDDTVARLGGDEFAVLLGRSQEPRNAADLAGRLISSVQTPIAFGEQPVTVGLSVGIALIPVHGADAESVLKRADLALYRAKADGRNTFRVFEPAMDEAIAERRALELDLRRAVEAGELTLHYQPQARTRTGKITGFEALVRWSHPARGPVPPSVFIPLAEETGLINAVGEWVLRAACREAAAWTSDLKIAVNLSPKQFENVDLPEKVAKTLAETGLPASRLELEITETVIINDMARALTILHRLKNLGVSIAMDDFGTGYSSLATLQAFPFDKIKIDRSFIAKVGDAPEAKAIVHAVLGLGRSLGMSVVAEGVETFKQMLFLRQEDCLEVQGFYCGRPEPISNYQHLTHARRQDRKLKPLRVESRIDVVTYKRVSQAVCASR